MKKTTIPILLLALALVVAAITVLVAALTSSGAVHSADAFPHSHPVVFAGKTLAATCVRPPNGRETCSFVNPNDY